MSGIDDALIDDVRALLASFRSAGLGSFSTTLRTGVEVTLVRDPLPSSGGRMLLAPHVATVAKISDEDGELRGITLELLDEPVFLSFDDDELVDELLVTVGDLVEYGNGLARLR